jgi:hypothetical protein
MRISFVVWWVNIIYGYNEIQFSINSNVFFLVSSENLFTYKRDGIGAQFTIEMLFSSSNFFHFTCQNNTVAHLQILFLWSISWQLNWVFLNFIESKEMEIRLNCKETSYSSLETSISQFLENISKFF